MRAFNDRFTPRKKFGLTIPVLAMGMLGFFLLIFSMVAMGTPNKGFLAITTIVFALLFFFLAAVLHKKAKLARIKGIIFTGNIDKSRKSLVIK